MKKVNIFLLLLPLLEFSNNLQISNVQLVNQNTTQKYTMIKFDISWHNSWRTSTFESNWDAVWIFAKYRKKWDFNWYHCFLNDVGHVAPAGSVITPGLVRTDIAFNATTNPAVGAFIYRSTNGIGNVSYNGVELRWNYGANGLQDYDSVEVCVYGIEMVYVPQGSFYLGDNVFPPGSNSSNYFVAGTTSNPFQVTSENPLPIDNTSTSSLWATGAINPTGTLSADFPKGYGSFYIMKYELTQIQYKEFLNKITRNQQVNRIGTTTVGNFFNNTAAPQNRNGIRCMNDPGAPFPRVYGNDLNNNNTADEPSDGQHISCNLMSFADLLAYADWAGLRPISEMEYEKACRGTLYPVANEGAWATPYYTISIGITNPGQNNEVATNTVANIVYGNHTNVQGPMRTGCFAGPSSNRISSGGSYYGAMDLSGNLWEYTYVLGVSNQRNFNKHYHGNGTLAANGATDIPNTVWPQGAGYRGGSWGNTTAQTFFQVSDRIYTTSNDYTQRYSSTGIRLARTQP